MIKYLFIFTLSTSACFSTVDDIQTELETIEVVESDPCYWNAAGHHEDGCGVAGSQSDNPSK